VPQPRSTTTARSTTAPADKYFRSSKRPDDGRDDCLLPRGKKIGFVNFHRRTPRRKMGARRRIPNEEVAEAAQANSDIHGRVRLDSIRTRERWAAAKRRKAGRGLRRQRASSFHPTVAGLLTSPTGWRGRSTRSSPSNKPAGPSSTAGHSGIGLGGCAAAAGLRLQNSKPDAARGGRRAIAFPDIPDHRSPIRSWPWAGRGGFSLAHATRPKHLDRISSGWRPEILPRRKLVQYAKHAAQGPDPLRQRLPADHARPLVEGLRGKPASRTRVKPADPQAETRLRLLGLG